MNCFCSLTVLKSVKKLLYLLDVISLVYIKACHTMPTCVHHLQQWFFTISIMTTLSFLVY